MQCTDKIKLQKKLGNLLLIAVLVFACFACYLPTVKAETASVTISANNTECDSVTIVGDIGGTQVISSFPGSYTYDAFYYGMDNVVVTVVAKAGYVFSYADDGGTSYLSNPFSLTTYNGMTLTFHFAADTGPTPTPDPSSTPAPSPTGYQYIVHGVYDENNPNTYFGNVTVTAYFPNGSVGIGGKSVEVFTVAGSYVYEPPSKPMYFSYDLSAYYSQNVTRQYWIGRNENTTSLYVYASHTDLASYAFSIFNYKSIDAFSGGAILTARSITDLKTIDRRLSDVLGTVNLELQPNTLYDITVESLSTGAVYNIGPINTASSVITLNVPSIAFPDSVRNLYTYSYAWAYREFGTNSIMVRYEDTTNQTTSLELIISDPLNSTVYFDQIFDNVNYTVNNFNYAWTYADNATSYNVWIIVTSDSVGTYYFKQYLLGMYTKASGPFDFSFMGSVQGIDFAVIIPALIIIMVAGVFSQLSAEVAAFLTSVTAIILVIIGWISISSSMLIVALSLSVLAGVVAARRRFA